MPEKNRPSAATKPPVARYTASGLPKNGSDKCREKPALGDGTSKSHSRVPGNPHAVSFNSFELAEDGLDMGHCVGDYTWWCIRGWSSIWSVRSRKGNRLRRGC
jgi:hypothetical protein